MEEQLLLTEELAKMEEEGHEHIEMRALPHEPCVLIYTEIPAISFSVSRQSCSASAGSVAQLAAPALAQSL